MVDKKEEGVVVPGNVDTKDGKAVEIERKFIVPDDCEEKLLKLGCHFNKQDEFTDDYYDTDNYQLALKDYWLRNRSGTWQMKYALPQLPHCRDTTRYCETETESEILDLLSGFSSEKAGSVQEFVRTNCQPLAVIKTMRKCYSYGNVTVALDITDCGFRIGEVEVVAKEGEGYTEGLKAVDDLASKLGFHPTKEGKLEHYLRTRNPRLYQLLLARVAS